MSNTGFSFICVALALFGSLAGCIGAEGEATQEDHSQHEQRTGGGDGVIRELPAHITGVIIDTELLPIAGADIVVTPGDHIVLTDGNGSFVVGPLEPGTYAVSASKRGYAVKEQQVAVTNDDETRIRLTLDAVASDVPYHETFSEAMYLICAFVSPSTPLGGINVPCAGLVDVLAGTTNSLDHWIFYFVIDKPGFKSLVMEMVWDSQQTGHDGLMQLSTEGRAAPNEAGGVTIAGSLYGGTQGPPFYMTLHAGQNYWLDGTDPESVFYPEANATETFKMLIAGGGGNTTVPGLGFFIEFRPTAYLTFFYNREATPDFTILPPQ